jgi:hypothetical protein
MPADAAPLDIRFYATVVPECVTCSRCFAILHAGDQSGHAGWHVSVEGRTLRSARYAGPVIARPTTED